ATIDECIAKHNDEIWAKRLAKADRCQNDLWNLVRKFKAKPIIIPPLKHNGTMVSDVQLQTEILADTFQQNMKLTSNWSSNMDLVVKYAFII
ncbi:jg4, partial [Pararge aegeria aegeria]